MLCYTCGGSVSGSELQIDGGISPSGYVETYGDARAASRVAFAYSVVRLVQRNYHVALACRYFTKRLFVELYAILVRAYAVTAIVTTHTGLVD